jgi:hypothetical protein
MSRLARHLLQARKAHARARTIERAAHWSLKLRELSHYLLDTTP